MRMSLGAKIFAVAFLALGVPAAAAPRRTVPFWPNEVPAAIHAQVDGNAALETVRELGRFHRVQGSAGLAAAAEHMRRKLVAAGLTDAAIEHAPADGRTRYAHFRSYYGWSAVSATLEETAPQASLVVSYPEVPVALADYSQSADVTAELVDVGEGTDAAHYAGKDVRGKIVLADGPLPRVHELACEERGAVGFLSAFPNQKTPWSGDDRDLVRWGHLSPYKLDNRFAFMVSKRQAETYRARLLAKEKIVLRARVRAKVVPATYDTVVATIPGTDAAAGEIVLTAHLCHESAGANDNASGSAAILEVARALAAGISRGSLPRPKRTLRFLWFPEIAGSQAYLVGHPRIAARMVAGIHMDMVGGLPSIIRGTLHVSRSAETLPHVVSDIARAWLDEVLTASARFAENAGDARAGFVFAPGSREALVADMRGIDMGSDHQVFEEASFGVPMVYFHDWPDVYVHTNKDQPENLDATKLGRVAYIGAGIAWTLAALPDKEARGLVPLARAAIEQRLALARASGQEEDARDVLLRQREAVATGVATLRSIAKLWPAVEPLVAGEVGDLEKRRPVVLPEGTPDLRVPVRDPGVRGPLEVYYYDHVREVLGPGAESALGRRDDGELLAFEALNLVDGVRTVAEIRDVLTGRYEPVSTAELAEHFELLARARVLRWK